MPAQMLVIYRINAADMERLDATIAELRQVKSAELKDVKKVPIGFGIEVIKAGFLVEAKVEGALEKLEAELKGLKSIESFEQEGMTLI